MLVPADADGGIEVRNMAVVARLRGTGIGRRLVATAVEACRAWGAPRVIVATATADVGNLRFYQRCGFRFASIERDAFTPDTGYPEPIEIDGIPLRDRIWLSMDLGPSTPGPGAVGRSHALASTARGNRRPRGGRRTHLAPPRGRRSAGS